MLFDHGYATCVSGKWQLDGGDRSIHKFGFENYSVFDPFDELLRSNDLIENKYRYKNPMIYQNNAYLPDSVTNGKYSDDMFATYACNFIEKNKYKLSLFIFHSASVIVPCFLRQAVRHIHLSIPLLIMEQTRIFRIWLIIWIVK